MADAVWVGAGYRSETRPHRVQAAPRTPHGEDPEPTGPGPRGGRPQGAGPKPSLIYMHNHAYFIYIPRALCSSPTPSRSGPIPVPVPIPERKKRRFHVSSEVVLWVRPNRRADNTGSTAVLPGTTG